ncbi:MAG: Flp pilus assembly protein TadD [Ascidiaceihabitans sp.]|jgi:Flp pilus assembly protein TadD
MKTKPWRALLATTLSIGLAACNIGGISASKDGVFAPGVDKRKEAIDGVEVGHRLIEAGEHELALRSFSRAALANGGVNAEILSGFGTANLGLGRLGEAERLLRRATERDDAYAEIWNNLGVVLMEKDKTVEAVQIFRKAFALSNGESTQIRDNLRLALAKSENPAYTDPQNSNYKLVRRGSSDYLISATS